MKTILYYGDSDAVFKHLEKFASTQNEKYETQIAATEEELTRILSHKEPRLLLQQKRAASSVLDTVTRAQERDAQLSVLWIPYDDELSAVRDFAEEKGVFVVPSELFFEHTATVFSLVTSAANRLSALDREKEKLSHKLIENRLVDRAKCILIQHLKLTELQAHKYLERQAMDLRLSREKVAQIILQTYEQS